MADPTTPPNHPRTEEELSKDLSIGQKGPTPYQSSATHDETGGPNVPTGDFENPNAATDASGLDEELEGPSNQRRGQDDDTLVTSDGDTVYTSSDDGETWDQDPTPADDLADTDADNADNQDNA